MGLARRGILSFDVPISTDRVQTRSKLRCCLGIISTSIWCFQVRAVPFSGMHTPVAECETTRCRRIGSGLGGGVASLFPRTRAVGTVPFCSSYLFNTGELLPTTGLLVLCHSAHIFFNPFKLRVITALLPVLSLCYNLCSS